MVLESEPESDVPTFSTAGSSHLVDTAMLQNMPEEILILIFVFLKPICNRNRNLRLVCRAMRNASYHTITCLCVTYNARFVGNVVAMLKRLTNLQQFDVYNFRRRQTRIDGVLSMLEATTSRIRKITMINLVSC